MKWSIAGAILAVVVQTQSPPADACGVKLTIKPTTPRRQVARTSAPAHVLLIGTQQRRLERELSSAGHDVEVAPTASAAKRKQYTVVVAEASQADEARATFGDAVIVGSGDPSADYKTVEGRVQRRPTAASSDRVALATKPDRQPIAAGPPQPEKPKVVDAKPAERKPEEAPAPKPEPKAVAAVEKPVEKPKPEPKAVETERPKPAVETPKPEPKPVVAKVAKQPGGEIYFAINQAKLSGTGTAQLAKTVKWLSDNASINVTIEGYADPSGNPAYNMTLSEKRAEAVKEQLVSAGIDASRLEVVGYGDTKIKYGASDGRNRRVAIVPKP